MSERKHNFNAGPAALPLPVLEQVQRELCDYRGSGMSVMEMSHRTDVYEEILFRARDTIARLYGLPDTHEVLFLQGGASLQFAMVPMNLGTGGAYVDTGTWSSKAISEAKLLGPVHRLWTGADEHYRRVPKEGELAEAPEDAPYLHYTSNNTIYGTQFHYVPRSTVPLVADLSSDFLSRPLDVRPFDLIYAGAQKNAGPSGVVVVIARKTISRGYRGLASTPKILRYVTQAENDSMYNTPNTFGIYVLGLVAEWVEQTGGLAAMAEINAEKARRLYETIDEDPRFEGHATEDSRSHMNVTWRMGDAAHEKTLLAAAEAAGIVGLKGHRSVGGLRASIYNAVPLASVDALIKLLRSH
ncbi:MAG: 3-phosphoserine/phosphohydroxythreonine transaminase [Myxococcales bacterium]|nr:3-phosphoserine/phosphohydroxythreonine transaminase [Myxococcales bacterium]